MGTVNVLESAFKTDSVEAVAVITTDKVYRNDNSGRSFIESDPLAGKDPYSASKVGTEAAVDRLLPDLIRGFVSGATVAVRNPESTRPWQHVLDPLWGYIMVISDIS